MNVKKSSKGFTLVELSIVIGIIAIMAAISVPAFVNMFTKADKKAKLDDVTLAVNDEFYRNEDLATLSDMRGYVYKIDDTLFELTTDGDIIESAYTYDELFGLDENGESNYEQISFDSTKNITGYKPTATTSFERAVKARNLYHTHHNLLENESGKDIFFEMNNFIITVYDADRNGDINYLVVYDEDNDLNGNGRLMLYDKTVEQLAKEGLEYTPCQCDDCAGNELNSYRGIVYVPTPETIVYQRILVLESSLPAQYAGDENTKASNFAYVVNGNSYLVDADNKVINCGKKVNLNGKIQFIDSSEEDEIAKITSQGYTSVTTVQIENKERKISEANMSKYFYGDIECYAIKYGYYDTDNTYHSWTEYKTAMGYSTDVTTLSYKEMPVVSQIKKIVLSDTVTIIDNGTFSNYVNLEEVVLPESLTNIVSETKSPFANGKISRMYVNERNEVYKDINDRAIVKVSEVEDEDEEGVFIVTQTLIYGTNDILTNGKLPKYITNIGSYAFEKSNITEVNIVAIPVGKGVFKDCTNLVSVAHDLIIVPDETFSGCENLQYFSQMNNLREIGKEAFKGCVLIDDIVDYTNGLNIPITLEVIGDGAFDDCGDILTLYYASSRRVFTRIEGYTNATEKVKIVYALSDITYDLNGGSLAVGADNPATYDSKLETALMIKSPEKFGADFINWTVSATDSGEQLGTIDPVENKFELKQNMYSGQNITLTAQYNQYIYEIRYYVNGEDKSEVVYEDGEFPQNFDIRSGADIYVPALRRDYYDFDGWYVGSMEGTHLSDYIKGTDYDDVLRLHSEFNAHRYNISYDYNGGVADNPLSYTVEDAVFTINNPVKQNYDFVRWHNTTNDTYAVNITVNPAEMHQDFSLVAEYKPTEYKLIYIHKTNLDSENLLPVANPGNPITYTVVDAPIVLKDPSISGYDFAGWYVNNEKLTDNTFVCENYSRDTVITGLFNSLVYKITYTSVRDGYDVPENHVSNYNNVDKCYYGIDTRLYLPSMQPGYKFLRWVDDSDISCVCYDEENDYYFLSGVTKDIQLCVVFELEQFAINYERYEATDIVDNPRSYNVEQDDIVLSDVQKNGYTFTGWTGSNGSTPQKGVVINCRNESGAKMYYANLEVIVYSITYNDMFNATYIGEENPSTYTVETGTFVLKRPIRTGYAFKGWEGTGLSVATMDVVIEIGQYIPREYTATWQTIEYDIIYNLDEGINNSDNPVKYTIEDSDIDIKIPTKLGYTFLGWSGTDIEGRDTEVTIPAGSYGEREFTANWNVNHYALDFVLGGGAAPEDEYPTTYTVNDELVIATPVKKGYHFDGWTGTFLPEGSYTLKLGINVIIGDNDIVTKIEKNERQVGDREYTAHWTKQLYEIKYELNGGIYEGEDDYNPNPKNFYVDTDTFTLVNPIQVGYVFRGWSGYNGIEPETPITIAKGSVDDRKYNAEWEIQVYNLTFNLNGGTGMESRTYTVESDNIEVTEPVKLGYEFLGWSGTDIPAGTYRKSITIIKGSTTGDKTYTANWSIITYTLNYGFFTINAVNETEPLSDVVVSPANPASFYVTTDTFTLTNPSKDGYRFLGWEESNFILGKSDSVTIEKGSTENREYIARFEIEKYTIRYVNLEGVNIASNPSYYYVTSSTIVINQPTKPGYKFLGWTGSSGDVPVKDVTIRSGSIGNREYVANWQIITYTINYTLFGGEFELGVEYPTTYTINTPNFTIPDPSKVYYRFDGWTGSCGEIPVKGVSVVPTADGYPKDLSFAANWTLLRYYISYHTKTIIDGSETTVDNLVGINEDPSSYPTEYYSTNDTFTLTNPTMNGYNFVGWAGTGINDTTMIAQILQGDLGDKDFTAVFEIAYYTIEYDYDGGSLAAGQSNPISYNIFDTFTLFNPSRAGYDFKGWTGSNGEVPQTTVFIAEGTSGEKNYTANWDPHLYTVYLAANGGTPNEENSLSVYFGEPMPEYTFTVPTKTGYNLKGYAHAGILYYNSVCSSARNWDVVVEDLDSSYWVNGSNTSLRLYAQWKAIDYTVTLNQNGGTGGLSSVIATYDSAMPTLSSLPSRTYYNLNGYFDASSGGTKYYNANGTSARNWDKTSATTLYAQWTPVSWTITYNYNGGSANNPATYTVEDQFTLAQPTRSGYVFGGYTGTGLGSSTKSVTITKGSTGNRSYTANWSCEIGPTSGSFNTTSTNAVSSHYPHYLTLSWDRTYNARGSNIHYAFRMAGASSQYSYTYVKQRQVIIYFNGSEVYNVSKSDILSTQCKNGFAVLEETKFFNHNGGAGGQVGLKFYAGAAVYNYGSHNCKNTSTTWYIAAA